MTDTTSKLRALFLAALMVFSVFAGTVALSGSVAAAESGNASDIGPVFQGEQVEVTNLSGVSNTTVESGDILQIREGLLGEGSGELAATATVESNGGSLHAVFQQGDTEGLSASGVERYHFLRVNGENIEGSQFEVITQDLSAGEYDGPYLTNESAWGASGVTITSANWFNQNRGPFNVTVNSDTLTQSEMLNLFGSAASAAGDESADPVRLTVDPPNTPGPSDGTSFGVNFDNTDLSTGTYNFTATSEAAVAEDTFSLSYEDPEEINVDASFDQNVYREDIGDQLRFTVDLTDTSDAKVMVDGDGYDTNITVQDGDDDDNSVTVEFNSYNAGRTGDIVEPVDSNGNDAASIEPGTETDLLAGDYYLRPGSFDLTVIADGEQRDVATMAFEARETTSISSTIAPRGASFGKVSEFVNGTESQTVAVGDGLALEVEASGLYGYLTDNSGLNNASGVELMLEQQNPAAYAQPKSFNTSNGNLTVMPDASNDRFFVKVNSGALGVSAGESYDVTFEVDGDKNPYVADGETETLTTSVSFVERSISFDITEGAYNVTNDANAEVRGTSSLAPGSSLTVRAIQGGDFLRVGDSVTVGEDGTFSATFDFSGQDVGETFRIKASGDGVNTGDVDAVFSDTPEWETQESSEALQAQIDELETLLNSTMDELNATESMLEQKNATIEELEQELNETGGASQELLDQKNATIAELQNQTEQLNQDLADAESQLLNQTTTIADLESEVSALNLSTRKWEAEASDLQNQTESLQSMLEAKNSTISDQESTISERDSTISELESEVSDLESQLEDAQSTTASGPGFTAVLALVALMGAALLAVRRQQ